MAGLDKILELAPWAVAATVLSIVLIVVVKLLGARARKSRGAGGGIMMQDIDKMVKAGSMTAEEAREVRRRMAERIAEKARTEQSAAAEAAILAQAKLDPDAVRQLLTPEALAEAERKKAQLRRDAQPPKPAATAPSGSPPRPMEQKAASPQPKAPEPAASEADLLDPLGGLAGGEPPTQPPPRPHPSSQKPAQPAMNMPRVVKEKREAATTPDQKKLDIDKMFEQGRISREEYEQLKQFFKDQE